MSGRGSLVGGGDGLEQPVVYGRRGKREVGNENQSREHDRNGKQPMLVASPPSAFSLTYGFDFVISNDGAGEQLVQRHGRGQIAELERDQRDDSEMQRADPVAVGQRRDELTRIMAP